MRFIIAEKPSVAREIASALGTFEKRDGYLENNQYIISWAFGHLCTLAQPHEYNPDWEKWNLDTLPIVPEAFKLTVTERKQFNVLKTLLNRKDILMVINSCDAGREGELIFRWIYAMARSRVPVRRLWLSETTPSAIREALNNLRPGSDYENLYSAAAARAKADWLVGINSTRAYTVRHGEKLTIGRVQTPTLAIIVSREREIRNFKPVPYWQVQALFETTNDVQRYQGLGRAEETDGDEGVGFKFLTEESARAFMARSTGTGAIARVSVTEKLENPPALFNLNDLQRETNRLFGMTAAQVLEVAQTLYEKKLLTYPRTDSRHLTTAMTETLDKRVEAAQKTTGVFLSCPVSTPGKRYVDDSKVTDHHAIIVTEIPAPEDLTDKEKKIYDLVARRFLAMFLPPARYRVQDVETQAGEMFFSKGKAVIALGWRELYNFKAADDDEKEEALPALSDGQTVKVVKLDLLKKETKPPARYTDASILSAMENAGRFIDERELAETLKAAGGIGTPATRASTIEKLITTGYVIRQKKNLVPTPKGEVLIDLVPSELKTPETTAEWENGLMSIEQGEGNAECWLDGITELTRKLVSIAIEQEPSGAVKQKVSLGKCPLCNKDVIEGKKGYGCSGFKEGCKFVIWKEVAGKILSVNQVKSLLEKGKTPVIKGFKSKEGKTFETALKLKDGKIEFDFPDKDKEPEALGKCPLCGKPITETNKAFSCSGYKEGCKFSIWKEISGKKLSINQAQELLKKGKTSIIKGFKSKAGKKFDAVLVLKEGKIEFEFPRERKREIN